MDKKWIKWIVTGIILTVIVGLILAQFFSCQKKSCIAGYCIFGKCFCKSGYGGDNCDPCIRNDDKASNQVCRQTCIHGTCNAKNQCKCQKGWQGTNCDKWNPKYGSIQ